MVTESLIVLDATRHEPAPEKKTPTRPRVPKIQSGRAITTSLHSAEKAPEPKELTFGIYPVKQLGSSYSVARTVPTVVIPPPRLPEIPAGRSKVLEGGDLFDHVDAGSAFINVQTSISPSPDQQQSDEDEEEDLAPLAPVSSRGTDGEGAISPFRRKSLVGSNALLATTPQIASSPSATSLPRSVPKPSPGSDRLEPYDMVDALMSLGVSPSPSSPMVGVHVLVLNYLY